MTPALAPVQCPYCWENFEIEVEPTDEPQTFIQDCEVCCRPISFTVSQTEDGVDVTAARSD